VHLPVRHHVSLGTDECEGGLNTGVTVCDTEGSPKIHSIFAFSSCQLPAGALHTPSLSRSREYYSRSRGSGPLWS
jgi:hypothetical protein